MKILSCSPSALFSRCWLFLSLRIPYFTSCTEYHNICCKINKNKEPWSSIGINWESIQITFFWTILPQLQCSQSKMFTFCPSFLHYLCQLPCAKFIACHPRLISNDSLKIQIPGIDGKTHWLCQNKLYFGAFFNNL